MATVGITGRKVTLNIPNGQTATDVVDLGLLNPDLATGTQVITKGAANGSDKILLNGQTLVSVQSIVSVVQGATTYTLTTDYLLTADAVDWSPGGAEPATGSQYVVTYTYLKITAARSYRRWDVQVIALATAHTGTVNLQVSDTETVAGNFRVLQSGAADIIIAPNKATPIIPLIARFMRLVSGSAEAAQRDFILLLSTITNER